MDDTRRALEDLIRMRGSSYSEISRLLGRNAAYIQQFIRRGSPKHLDEQDRSVLARFFGVDETVLGAQPRRAGHAADLVAIPVLDVEASAGYGGVAAVEAQSAKFGFDEKWLRRLTASKASNLSIIGVLGDSMEPTLHDGDEVMVDLGDGQARLRDGIYVLRMDDMLSVKRIAIEPQGKRVSVLSDNPTYPNWRGLEKRMLNIVGRVLWFGRTLR
jgi:phage repressor protein C with HTH and peptisase S24 domain